MGDLIEPKFSTSGFWILRKSLMKNVLGRMRVFVACTRFEKPEQFRCFLTTACGDSFARRSTAVIYKHYTKSLRRRVLSLQNPSRG